MQEDKDSEELRAMRQFSVEAGVAYTCTRGAVAVPVYTKQGLTRWVVRRKIVEPQNRVAPAEQAGTHS